MTKNETLLREANEGLSEIIKPYQREQNQRQQKINLVHQCIRCLEKDDFLQLDELLKNKLAEDIENEQGLDPSKAIFDRLRIYANEKVDRYRIEFIEDMKAHAEEAELPLEIDFPRFMVLKGIDGHFDFSARQTTINEKKLKSIDPKRIVALALKFKKQLYDRPFDPQRFINDLHQIYGKLLKSEHKSSGAPLPMQRFYLEYVISLQSRTFFQNMDKGKFRGYSLDQFAVDLWRYFQARTGGASGKYALELKPGRINALWLIDSDGERRQITTISFQEHQ